MLEPISAVLTIGVLVTMASILGLLAKKIGFPRVVIYILVGALFSPGLFGSFIDFSTEGWSAEITNIALGIIAYLIGSEINLQDIKKEEKTIFFAVVGQSLGALLFIGFGIWGLSQVISSLGEFGIFHALVFGAVATATAPAATLGVIEEYGAKGKLTNILLGVIAVDDAIGVIFFTLVLGLGAEGSFSESILTGLKEVLGAVLLGGILGVMLGYIGKGFKKEELRLATILGFIFLVYGLSRALDLSMLLSCMTLGFVSVLFYSHQKAEWLLPLQHIEELVFIFFFTLAGIHFKIEVFTSSLFLVLIYTVLRVLGKYLGAFSGLSLAGSNRSTKKLLGLCLFPQAGVAIGLAIQASNQPGFEEFGSLLMNVILGSTIIFGLFAPFATRFALKRSGDISEEGATEN